MGATQIIDEGGNVICRLLYNGAAGIITSDVQYNTLQKNSNLLKHKTIGFLKCQQRI